MTEAVGECSLSLLVALLGEFDQQQAECLHERREQTAHEDLLPVSRALAVDDQNAGRLEHEQLIVAAQERREAVLLEECESYS